MSVYRAAFFFCVCASHLDNYAQVNVPYTHSKEACIHSKEKFRFFSPYLLCVCVDHTSTTMRASMYVQFAYL